MNIVQVMRGITPLIEQLAAYPKTPGDEMSVEAMRKVARDALSIITEAKKDKIELDPSLKEALQQAAETRSTAAITDDGRAIFINYGEQPEDTTHLNCPACGGSGHIGDVEFDVGGNPKFAPTVLENAAAQTLNGTLAWLDSDRKAPFPDEVDSMIRAILLTFEQRRKNLPKQSPPKNAIVYTAYDNDGRCVANGVHTSYDAAKDLHLMTGFIELEKANRMRNVEIKPFKLGALWVSSIGEGALQIERERSALADAIRNAAVSAGICRADASLTGPQLVMLCDDMATCINQKGEAA